MDCLHPEPGVRTGLLGSRPGWPQEHVSAGTWLRPALGRVGAQVVRRGRLLPRTDLPLPGSPVSAASCVLNSGHPRYGVPRGPDRGAQPGPSGPGQRPGGGHHLLLTLSHPSNTRAGWGWYHMWLATEVSRIAPQLSSLGPEPARSCRGFLVWSGGADARSVLCAPGGGSQ